MGESGLRALWRTCSHMVMETLAPLSAPCLQLFALAGQPPSATGTVLVNWKKRPFPGLGDFTSPYSQPDLWTFWFVFLQQQWHPVASWIFLGKAWTINGLNNVKLFYLKRYWLRRLGFGFLEELPFLKSLVKWLPFSYASRTLLKKQAGKHRYSLLQHICWWITVFCAMASPHFSFVRRPRSK